MLCVLYSAGYPRVSFPPLSARTIMNFYNEDTFRKLIALYVNQVSCLTFCSCSTSGCCSK